MIASACGVLKSSSSTLTNGSHSPSGAGSEGFRNTSRNPSARDCAAAIVSSEKSIGLRQ